MCQVCSCQLTSPEMFVCCTLSIKSPSVSKNCSDETFHQKCSDPGPVNVVCTVDCWLSVIVPLCAASTPSCVTDTWPNHVLLPLVVHNWLPGVSSAAPSDVTTVRLTTELVTE